MAGGGGRRRAGPGAARVRAARHRSGRGQPAGVEAGGRRQPGADRGRRARSAVPQARPDRHPRRGHRGHLDVPGVRLPVRADPGRVPHRGVHRGGATAGAPGGARHLAARSSCCWRTSSGPRVRRPAGPECCPRRRGWSYRSRWGSWCGSTARRPRAAGPRRPASRAEQARRQADEERLRIAQEVHDVVGHGLAAISMQAEIALHLLPKRPEQAEAALTAISRTSREALDELRVTLGAVRQGAEREPVPGLARLPGAARPARRGRARRRGARGRRRPGRCRRRWTWPRTGWCRRR